MLNLKNRCPIGIEIADHNIYAAQLKKTRQGITVRELFHRKLANGQTESIESLDDIVPVLKEIVAGKTFPFPQKKPSSIIHPLMTFHPEKTKSIRPI